MYVVCHVLETFFFSFYIVMALDRQIDQWIGLPLNNLDNGHAIFFSPFLVEGCQGVKTWM